MAEPLEVAPTETFPLEELREPEYNINRMDAVESAGLETSMEEFGVVEYPVVNVHPDRRGVIVGGSHRVGKAQEKGQQELPCIVVNLKIERERELNLRLNKHRGRPQAALIRQYFGVDELTAVGYTPGDLASWEMLSQAGAADLEAAATAAGQASAGPGLALDVQPGSPPAAVPPPGGPVFTPAIPGGAPGDLGVKPVTAADVDKAQGEMDGRFAGEQVPPGTVFFECVCPHCGEDFSFRESRAEIKKRMEGKADA